MARQTSVQITEATDRQVKALQDAGFGTFTDIVRIAIDRMHNEEMGKMDIELTLEDTGYEIGDNSIYIARAPNGKWAVGTFSLERGQFCNGREWSAGLSARSLLNVHPARHATREDAIKEARKRASH